MEKNKTKKLYSDKGLHLETLIRLTFLVVYCLFYVSDLYYFVGFIYIIYIVQCTYIYLAVLYISESSSEKHEQKMS